VATAVAEASEVPADAAKAQARTRYSILALTL